MIKVVRFFRLSMFKIHAKALLLCLMKWFFYIVLDYELQRFLSTVTHQPNSVQYLICKIIWCLYTDNRKIENGSYRHLVSGNCSQHCSGNVESCFNEYIYIYIYIYTYIYKSGSRTEHWGAPNRISDQLSKKKLSKLVITLHFVC